jgi:SprB repeat
MKLIKLMVLMFLGAFAATGAFAQANVTLNMLTLNSGDVIINGSGVLQATVGNTGPSTTIPNGRLNVQISVPSTISIATTQSGLPAGWTVTNNNGSVINICNSSTTVPVGTATQLLIALQGGPAAASGVISGQISFRTNCSAPGSLSGNNPADDASTAGYNVVAGAACNITGAAASAGTIACNGGTTTLTVAATTSGSTGTLEYSIGGAYQSSPSFTVAAGSYTAMVREAGNTGCNATAAAVVVAQPALLTASNTSTAILCFGGTSTVVISATGGTAPYTGEGSFTQSAGTQTYTVTDANGCTATTTVTASQPASAVAASSTQTPIVCGGTSTVVISGTGGTAPYTGEGTFSQPAGSQTYTVTDANGCSATVTVVVTAPNGPSVTFTQSPVACFGGSSTVVVSATGGTAPYTGDGSFTQAAGTTQSYTVTDANGCTGTVTVTVNNPAPVPVPTITSTNNGNGTFTLTAGNFTGSLLWSTGATTSSILVSTAGVYTLTQTVGSCTSAAASQTVTIGNAIADPAVGQMFFTTLADANTSANTLLFTQDYKLNVPVYNLNQFTAIPSSAINFRINLGTRIRLDAAYNLATAPLSQYFAFTPSIVADSQIITGVQIAEIPADFNGIAVFQVEGTLSCTSRLSSQIVITNSSASLTDEDLNNNLATLQYTLPVTISATAVNVTCNGAANGNITVVTSPGVTYVIRNASNAIVTAPLAPGSYTVEATATGDAPLSNTCVTTSSVTITEPAVLVTTVIGTTAAICNGGNTGTITVSSVGGTSPYTYVIAGPTVNTTGAVTGVFTDLTAGSYTITTTDANGCTATVTAVVGQPSGTNTDLSLGSDITGSLFATNGTSHTIVYNISEIAGNPAVGDTLRITKVAGFDITFNDAITSVVVTPTTYTLDNPNWKVDNSNPAFVSIIKKAAGNLPGPGTIGCGETVFISVTLTRNTTDISTFPLSARIRKADGELNLSNNFNSIIFTAE